VRVLSMGSVVVEEARAAEKCGICEWYVVGDAVFRGVSPIAAYSKVVVGGSRGDDTQAATHVS